MLENIDFNSVLNTYALLSIPFGWMFISKLQRNLVFFTSISNYILMKLVLSTVTGGFVAPFYVFGFIFKLFFKKKSKTIPIR